MIGSGEHPRRGNSFAQPDVGCPNAGRIAFLSVASPSVKITGSEQSTTPWPQLTRSMIEAALDARIWLLNKALPLRAENCG